MFVLMKRKGVGKLEGMEEVHEKERTGLHGVDMWTKAFDHHTCSNYQATDLDIIVGKSKWKDMGQYL